LNKIIPFLNTWLSKSGDTTFWSWIITIMYVVVVSLSLYYTNRIKTDKERHFLWVCISLFILAMGINKQLDFQILLTMAGKTLAGNLNLMNRSRILWKTLAVGILFSAVIGGIIILYKSRRILNKEKLTIGGVAILLFFTLTRVGSISQIRIAIILQYYVISRIHAVELLGLLIISLSLILKLRNIRKDNSIIDSN